MARGGPDYRLRQRRRRGALRVPRTPLPATPPCGVHAGFAVSSADIGSIPGRCCGLDLGEKRIGVAVSDDLRMTVRPLGVIESRGPKADARSLRGMLDGLDVVLLVAGVPVLPSGDEGPSAARCREKGADLARRLALPLSFVDESDTTLEAQRILADRPKRRADGPESQVDALAAALLLEAWLADQGRLE